MGEAKDNEVYEEDLVDYKEEVENAVDGAAANTSADIVKKGYVGIARHKIVGCEITPYVLLRLPTASSPPTTCPRPCPPMATSCDTDEADNGSVDSDYVFDSTSGTWYYYDDQTGAYKEIQDEQTGGTHKELQGDGVTD